MTHPRTLRRFSFLLVMVVVCFLSSVVGAEDQRPNIVVIFGDDMGIDSLGAFNDKLGLKTPHLDRLASEGLSFMDAHSTSGVCSPSRYSLLTGRYHWRSRLKRGIVGRWEQPLIEKGRLTLPSMLKQHGYITEMIGKWHLGHHWPKKGGGVTNSEKEIDFTRSITGGPNAIGFDHWFGDDVPNWPPYAWREDDRLIGEITTTSQALGLTKYTGVGNGPAVANWKLEAVLPEYARRCSAFIREQAGRDQPFFLYFPMPSPHTPIVPDEHWKGSTGISDYADFLQETDWAVGELLKALDKSGQADNTLIVFTTDNGTSPKANFAKLEAAGVHLREHWRGNKADAFEGGHRVPFIVRWPGHVNAGTRTSQIITQADILATLADIVGHDVPETDAEDSVSLLPVMTGDDAGKPLHEAIINHSISGHFAVRSGKWKVLFCRGSGGWSAPREADAAQRKLPAIQLYDLEADPKESKNVAADHPEVVARLTAILRRYVEQGRSTDGPAQANHDGAMHWGYLPWKPAAKSASNAQSTNQPETDTKVHATETKSRKVVTVTPRSTATKALLPTPMANIVRAWAASGTDAADVRLLRWSFNRDATQIWLHAPADMKQAELTTAEKSGQLENGTIVFSALDAKVVGEKAKLETHPGNHRIGFWTAGTDYVTWDIDLKDAVGDYDVELVYSRSGKLGAEAAVQINESSLPVKLNVTGSWYDYHVHPIGSVTLNNRKSHTVTVKSTKQIGAVMNLKAVLLLRK